jgi:hypothetical protein
VSASATTARATPTAAGRPGAATLTMQMISSAVCELTVLARLFDAAWLAAARTLPGGADSRGLDEFEGHVTPDTCPI